MLDILLQMLDLKVEIKLMSQFLLVILPKVSLEGNFLIFFFIFQHVYLRYPFNSV